MNSSNIKYYSDSFDYIMFCIYQYVTPIVQIISSLANLTSIIIFLTKSWRKNVCVFYLTCYTSLSLCFIGTSLFNDIFQYILAKRFYQLNDSTCKLFRYSYYLFATLAPNVLIFASIDRFLLSSHKADTRLYSSKRLAYFSLGISSALWALYYLHIIIKSRLSPLGDGCIFDPSEPYISFVYYSLAAANIIGCLTIAILILISLKNIRYFRSMSQQQRTRQVHTMKRKDFQLLRCLCALDIAYTLFSMLSIVYDILYAFLLEDNSEISMQQVIYLFLSKLFTFLTIIPYGSCFLVFFIISKAFRREIKRVAYKIVGQYLTPLREDENNVKINIVAISS